MKTIDETVKKFLDLINQYPSPHNGQPIRLKQLDHSTFDIIFERTRGLQAADISYIFSFVSMGVFVEHLRLCAKALGHQVSIRQILPAESELHGDGQVKFSECTISWNQAVPDSDLVHVIRSRRTSRKKYYSGVPDALQSTIVAVAAAAGMKLCHTSKDQAHHIVWLNQRAVFDDMFDEPVRQELDHWLRYTRQQKERTKDGLSYDCMELNGTVLKYIVARPGILRAPLVSRILKWYYLKTIQDSSDVFYMLAPFDSESAAFKVGEIILRIWMKIAAEGYYLHPFGTIMSNLAAHEDFIRLVGVENESRKDGYLVFIFRAGKSKPPEESLRIPIEQHLIQE